MHSSQDLHCTLHSAPTTHSHSFQIQSAHHIEWFSMLAPESHCPQLHELRVSFGRRGAANLDPDDPPEKMHCQLPTPTAACNTAYHKLHLPQLIVAGSGGRDLNPDGINRGAEEYGERRCALAWGAGSSCHDSGVIARHAGELNEVCTSASVESNRAFGRQGIGRQTGGAGRPARGEFVSNPNGCSPRASYVPGLSWRSPTKPTWEGGLWWRVY